jgi:threonine/homoserine/homoserine lactone efflux protein
MTSFLTGLALGFSAGVSPGPLTSLVVQTSLERGFYAGVRVAIAPLLTDALIILVATLLVRSVPVWAQTLLATIGGCFLLYLGYETLNSARHAELLIQSESRPARVDLGRGVVVNLLSPHPWLFWITIGAPILVTAARSSPASAAAFLFGFYVVLVGSKVALAGIVARARGALSTLWYRRVLAASGLMLVLFGALLLLEAVRVTL